MRSARPMALVACLLLSASATSAQVLIPNQPHETLELELHAMRDKVTLYMGDPQELLRLWCRPVHVKPRVEYNSQARATLRIRDDQLFGKQPPGDLESMAPNERAKYLSAEQTWEARLSPSGPTTFRLQIDDGEGVLDFTDFEVQEVRVKAKNSKLDIEIGRPNPMQMEVFGTSVQNGSIEFRKMLNARAKTMGFITTGSVCTFEITGKPYEGETQILIEGAAEELNFVLSKKVGIRVSGPSEALAHFQSKNFVAEGESLVSKDFANAKCKILLSVSQAAAKMNVEWD